jgi:hypothetical protein
MHSDAVYLLDKNIYTANKKTEGLFMVSNR